MRCLFVGAILSSAILSSCARHDRFIDNRPDIQSSNSPLLKNDELQVTTERSSVGNGYQLAFQAKPNANAYLEILLSNNQIITLDQSDHKKSEFRMDCQANQKIGIAVRQIQDGRTIQTGEGWIVCPLDVSVSDKSSQKSLQQAIDELSGGYRNTVSIGKMIFGSPNSTLTLALNRDTVLIIQSLDLTYKGTIKVITGQEWQKHWTAYSSQYVIKETARRLLYSDDVIKHFLPVDSVTQDLKNKSQMPLSPVYPPKLTIYVLDGSGVLDIQLEGAPGIKGLPGEVAFSPWAKYVAEKPMPRGANGKNGESTLYQRAGEPPQCVPLTKKSADPGKPGPDGIIPGAPGTAGSPGGDASPLDFFYLGNQSESSKIELQVTLSPGRSQAGGAGSSGQPGGPGGIGGLKACSEERVANGPRGKPAREGAQGGIGKNGRCSPVTLSPNLNGFARIQGHENCSDRTIPFTELYQPVTIDKVEFSKSKAHRSFDVTHSESENNMSEPTPNRQNILPLPLVF